LILVAFFIVTQKFNGRIFDEIKNIQAYLGRVFYETGNLKTKLRGGIK
jgi:hypothetical protein